MTDNAESFTHFLQQMLTQHDRTMVAREVVQNRLEDLVRSLDGEQLSTLGAFLRMATDSKRAATYWVGRVDAELIQRDLCPGCGINHMAEAMEEISAIHAVEPERLQPEFVQGEFDFDSVKGLSGKPEKNILENMEAWGVAPDEPMNLLGGVHCVACNWPSTSLEDRMLRPPKMDGCPGCQDRSAHG